MSVSSTSIAHRVPARTLPGRTNSETSAVEPLQGSQARVAADVQGHVWGGMADSLDISEVVRAIDLADASGDAIRPLIWRAVVAAAASAKRRRDYETYALLMEAIGLIPRYEEHEAHEDSQRRVIERLARMAHSDLGDANVGLAALLGWQDQPEPADAEALCGIVRPPDRPSVGRGLTTLPCDRPATHTDDPNDLGCLFVVVPEVQP